MDYIIKDGKSNYVIIYPDLYSESEFYAANELCAYLKKVTGASLPVISESQSVALGNDLIISVGATKLLDECGFNIDYSSLNGDGYIIKTKGANLFLNGLTPRGKIYSVYGYLEKICGIKFLDVEYEYIPKLNALSFSELDITEIPSFYYRGALSDATYHFPRDTAQAFATKRGITHEFLKFDQKFGGTININTNTNPTHNNLTYVFLDTEYCRLAKPERAEYYKKLLVSDDGAKKLTFNFKEQGSDGTIYERDYPTDICYTDGINDDGTIIDGDNIATRYLKGLKHYITLNPNAEYYVCGQEDIRNCCDCERCKASNAIYGGACGTVIRFYNAIARAIQDWANAELNGKRIKIMMFSYYFTAIAPVIERGGEFVPVHPSVVLADNVVIRFADITANYCYSFLDEYHSNLKPNQVGYGYGVDYFDKWKAIFRDNEVWYWGYTTSHSHYFSYVATMGKLSKSLKGLKDVDCKYVILQHNTTEHVEFKAIMETYISAKMLWDCTLSVDDLRKEFITYYYGEIAGQMTEIVRDLEQVTANALKINADDAYWDFFNLLSKIYTVDSYFPVLEKVNLAIDKAMGITDLDERARLTKAIKTVKLFPLYSIMNLQKKDMGEEFKPTAETKEFFELCEELGVKDYGEHMRINNLKTSFGL